MKINQLIEKLQDVLFDIKETTIQLYEMSQPQSKVRENVRNLSTQIIKHLIKIILYGGEEQRTLHHWCAELNNWLEECTQNKIKKAGKDRYPTAQELKTWLTDYYSNSGDIERMRSGLEKQYIDQGHKKRNVSNDLIYEHIIYILDKLCPCVEKDENTVQKVQEIIEPYILR